MAINLESILRTTGYLGLFGIVFTESGLLIGLLLPGDSLLFTAGFLASQGILDISTVIVITAVAAILGDSVGYALGRRYGPRFFKRPDARLFNVEHLRRSQAFYAKHGGKTIVLARFVPIIRTFAPVLAGVGQMPYRTFLSFNIIGGAMWSVTVPLLGYYLGRAIPNIDRYLLPIVGLIVLLSLLPTLIHLLRHPGERARIISSLKRLFTGQPKS
ncbi:VTT domain-containing protein [Candidatus Microgenomates bacterium]|nr:VTT domain-containing protein [Candidatus Microgenomates bacterium]